ncbi:conserved hypothetical protein [Candidatus Sulfopaludibacter sp. SbA4]|nr:conserved hypothetical protein [Candidatus Sulfopaludibacter sp. SbA4]
MREKAAKDHANAAEESARRPGAEEVWYDWIVADEIGFEWDEVNVAHLARHHVTPQERAKTDLRSSATPSFRVVLLVWTDRKGLIRPITAREVGKRMREGYFRSRG